MKPINEVLINKIFEYVKEYQLANGISPTFREIQNTLKISSLSVVKRYVDILKSRNVFSESENGGIDTPEGLSLVESKIVPLVGRVACGKPILAIENIEGNYKLPKDLLGNGKYFMLEATGDSMIGIGIHDGDILIVREQPSAEYGEIVIALIDGEATAKTYKPGHKQIVLQSENPLHKDIVVKGQKLEKNIKDDNVALEIKADEFKILGVVESWIHQHKRSK